tara:strand:- start:2141 stop:3031 length:891 start_codon:yes stop_codon:yes gene_type:complete
MNFKQLTYFIAVAEELHFGRAAERLGIAQPPLSRQIKQMEEELEAILFSRGRSAITLTPAGERLLIRGRDILATVDDTRREVRRIGQGADGRLRIGFVGSSTYGILPNIVKSFRITYPGVMLSLVPMNNAQLHRQLVGREIDVAFSRPALNDAEFATKKLMEERLILALPDTIDTGSRIDADLGQLAHHNLILYPEYPRPSYADFVLKACQDAGFEAPNQVFTMDLQTALSLVAIGEGVCIVPETVGATKRPGLKWAKIEPEIARTALSMNYRLDEQGVHLRNFISTAQKVARKSF